jgi:diguanylate cyclase (GGDEF)-like protein/PAS domain S-box-containing protein
MRARERWSRALIEQSGDLVLVLDAGARLVFTSPGTADVLGHSPSELVGHHIGEYLRPGEVERFEPLWADLLDRPGGHSRIDVALVRPDASLFHVEAICTNLLDDDAVRGVVVNARDVTARRHLEHQLVQRAFRDELTGLPNRAQFLDRLDHALTVAGRTGERLAVLFLDLNGFKTVNDTLGHAAGDELLVKVSDQLRSSLRPTDTVARLAGDEFTVLVADVTDDVDALDAAGRIVAGLAVPTMVAGEEIEVGASVGIAFSEPGIAAAELLRNADTAMYEAKADDRGPIVVFEPAMLDRAWSRLRVARKRGVEPEPAGERRSA